MSTPPPPGGYPPPGAATPPPGGYYPEQAYYAPGWSGPVPAPPQAPRPRRGRRVVLAVIASLVIVSLVAGGAVVARFLLERRPLGEVVAPVSAHVGRLQPGHCLATLPADGDVARVDVVPCSTRHEAEVIGLLDLPGDPWPGQQAVDARVQSWCEMDTAQREAGFHAVVWTPSELGWGQGDRTGVCLAAAPGGAVGSFTAGDAA